MNEVCYTYTPNQIYLRIYLTGDFENSICTVYLFTNYGNMKFTTFARGNKALPYMC